MNSDGKVVIKEDKSPVMEKGSILLNTLFSEVCGTDVHLMHGQLTGVPYPIIPGHVSTGVIEVIEGEVRDVDGEMLKIGDVVTFLDVHETCNACWFCLVAKESTRCPSRKVYGITYSADEGLLGGWSEKIYLKPGVKVLKLPSIDFARTFISAGCGLPTAIHAIQRADIQLGDTVVIQGSGPVGLMAAILAKIRGAFSVLLIGGPSLRLDIAREFGIEHVFDIFEYDLQQRLQEVMKRTKNIGADVVIEATGIADTVKEGLSMVRDGGTYVVVGQYTNAGEIAINPHLDINRKHIKIKGSWGSDFSHFYLAVKFVEKFKKKLPWEKIISKEYSLTEVRQALDDVMNYKIMKAVIKPN